MGRTSTHRNQCIETRSRRTTQLRRYYWLRRNLVATGSSLEQVLVAVLESTEEQVLAWEQQSSESAAAPVSAQLSSALELARWAEP